MLCELQLHLSSLLQLLLDAIPPHPPPQADADEPREAEAVQGAGKKGGASASLSAGEMAGVAVAVCQGLAGAQMMRTSGRSEEKVSEAVKFSLRFVHVLLRVFSGSLNKFWDKQVPKFEHFE